MQSRAAPDTDPPVLVAAWLSALARLLEPLAPTAVALLGSASECDAVQWLDALPPGRFELHAAVPEGAAIGPGWLIPLSARDGRAFALLVRSDERLAATAPELSLAASLAKLAWRLHWPHPDGVLRDGVGESLHALRNGLNSVMMSAAVISGPKLPLELRGFAADLENGTRRSLRALADLSALLREG